MKPVTGLALGRIVIGLTALVSPDAAAKLVDTPGLPQRPDCGYDREHDERCEDSSRNAVAGSDTDVHRMEACRA